jgi:hypothetical protein
MLSETNCSYLMELKHINFPDPIEGSEASMIIYRRDNLAREDPGATNEHVARHDVIHAVHQVSRYRHRHHSSSAAQSPGVELFCQGGPPGAIL